MFHIVFVESVLLGYVVPCTVNMVTYKLENLTYCCYVYKQISCLSIELASSGKRPQSGGGNTMHSFYCHVHCNRNQELLVFRTSLGRTACLKFDNKCKYAILLFTYVDLLGISNQFSQPIPYCLNSGQLHLMQESVNFIEYISKQRMENNTT